MNGARRPRPTTTPARLAALEQWQDDHEHSDDTRWAAVEKKFSDVDGKLGHLSGQIELLIQGVGVSQKARPDGSTVVRTKLLKMDWKLALSILGASTGIALAYRIFVPAMVEFAVNVHRAIMGAG